MVRYTSYPVFPQRGQWYSHILIGHRASIATSGCLVCCVASIIGQYDGSANPGLVAWTGLHVGLFMPDGRMIFNGLKKFGLEPAGRDTWRKTPAPVSEIRERWKRNAELHLILEIESKYLNSNHWVLCTAWEQLLYAVDPWFGEVVPVLAAHGVPGWTEERLITGAVWLRWMGENRA